jgi:hypothetical protein
MTELEALKFFGYSVGVAASFGVIFGVIYFWLPKNIE